MEPPGARRRQNKSGTGGSGFLREGRGRGSTGSAVGIRDADDETLTISKSDGRGLADSMANGWSLGELIMTKKYMIGMVGISWLAEPRRLANAMPKATQEMN